ncbi:hypothetical protein ABC733_13560 [Mangrovibacter sp. SLW1]
MPQRLFLFLARYLKHGVITPVLFLAACWLVGNAPLAQASESSPAHISLHLLPRITAMAATIWPCCTRWRCALR